MISWVQHCLKNTQFLIKASISSSLFHATGSSYQEVGQCDIDILIAKVHVGSSDDEVFQCLVNDQECSAIQLSDDLVGKLLHRFKNDWRSALGSFRWAASHPGYKHRPDAYDTMIDILGKMKQMDKMREFLEEMRENHLVTLNTVAKVMRRFAGAGRWEDAVQTFDELGKFGLEKNTKSMNLLLDTLCKENKVEQAREIFLELKSHILPDAHTFNIFIHGWCKVNRGDEAHWTIQEMKGHGCRPCVISYSTIIQSYCQKYNFSKVYELLDEMVAQGCHPNSVTYTIVMCWLSKSQEFEEALQIAERMKTERCKPDTHFYNCLIHTLGQAGKVQDAVYVFEVEMLKSGVIPNASTYNSMISMFCCHDQEHKAFNVLKEMEDMNLCKPDVQTYYPLLKLCFRTNFKEGLLSMLLNDIVNKHHLSLDLSTYSLLIHGLCKPKVNKIEWAYQLFEAMIGQDILPRYQTCRLLLDGVRENNMHDAAERIEDFMKKL
ncbi:hypothetical protein SLEP1_g50765 [Rubroshorea leprosula]|uniref:Pentatricopeptide repeat-containing protein n=1 Tax=Rubroshorea leprosula TaxID=152421 RepID=A0AAV5M4A1_9ROSI|nr:hypothetical protein SLEP1_g50765 [Rubroshorea leprosula]